MLLSIMACMTGGDKDRIDVPIGSNSNDSEQVMDTAADTGVAGVDLCDAVFLLELGNNYTTEFIWRYDINSHQNELVGQLNCPKEIPGDYLVALSADSKGLLWAITDQSDVYAIRNDTLDCSYTQIRASSEQPPFIGRSLAFMRQDPDSDDELYFSGLNQYPPTSSTPAVIAKRLDNGVGNVTTISSLIGNDAFIDLAGTADGRLFGLRPNGSETAIVEIDPSGSTILQEWPTTAPAPQGWSFVWHDNSFWMFVSSDATSTEVYHFEPATNTLDLVNTVNYQVVGAALPACAEENSGS